MDDRCAVHKLVADVAMFSGGKVLLVKYRDVARYDGQRGWFLPDDFLAHQEHPQEAAKRIALDQAGIQLAAVQLNHIESFGNGAWHLVFHLRADLTHSPTTKPGPNIAAVEWFDRKELPARSLVAHRGWALDVLEAMSSRGRKAV